MSTLEGRNERCLAPNAIHHGLRAVIEGEAQLERHEILQYLRCQIEPRHRQLLDLYTREGFRMEHLSQLNPYPALDFQNKTVSVYLLNGGAETKGLVGLLIMVIHNYVYCKWLCHYRSDIE